MFAALSTVKTPVVQREIAPYLDRHRTWYEQRLPMVEHRILGRLAEPSNRLREVSRLYDYAFSAADLVLVQVRRRLKESSLYMQYPNLFTHVARGEARPAFKRVF